MEQIFNDAIVQIVGALLGLAVSYAVFFITKAQVKIHEATAQKIADDSKKKLIDDAVDRVIGLTQNTVLKIEQVSASALREAVKDGTIEKSELESLGKQAVQEVYSQLTEESKALLQTQVVDIQKYILDLVEKTVFEIKNK
jgi:hypothetical protein